MHFKFIGIFGAFGLVDQHKLTWTFSSKNVPFIVRYLLVLFTHTIYVAYLYDGKFNCNEKWKMIQSIVRYQSYWTVQYVEATDFVQFEYQSTGTNS